MTAPDRMTDDLPALLDSLEASAAAATPGPWVTLRMRGDIVTSVWGADVHNVLTTHDVGPLTATDAALIVAAVNAAPTLIAELRAHQAAVQAVRELADQWPPRAYAIPIRDIRDAVAALDPKEQTDE